MPLVTLKSTRIWNQCGCTVKTALILVGCLIAGFAGFVQRAAKARFWMTWREFYHGVCSFCCEFGEVRAYYVVISKNSRSLYRELLYCKIGRWCIREY
jgi:hypothetical protein